MFTSGKYSEASLAAEKQLTLAELSKNKKSEASARYNAGVVAYMQGRHIATESEDQINAYNCFIRAQDHLQVRHFYLLTLISGTYFYTLTKNSSILERSLWLL